VEQMVCRPVEENLILKYTISHITVFVRYVSQRERERELQ